MRFSVVLFVCFLLDFAPAFSQKEIANQSNAWLVYIGNHKINARWGIHTDYQFRRSEFLKDWQQSLTRVGLEYYTKKGPQFTAGYAHVRTFPYGEQQVLAKNDEHRLWQQVSLKNSVGRFDLQHRYRLEQRLLEKFKITPTDNVELDERVLRHRMRYRLQLQIPINNDKMEDNTVFFSASDEIFLGFGKGVAKNVMDQNRMYAGFGYRFSQALNLQLGYLNQYVVKSDGVQIERNHTVQMGLVYNHTFKRLKKEDFPLVQL
jgi:hypothetical protein